MLTAGFCLLFRHMMQTEGTAVTVSFEGQIYGTYPLSEDREIPVYREGEGEIRNIVVVEDGTVYMKEADCPDKLCIRQGKISRTGESIICLPNRVTVTIEGDGKQEYDVISG